MAIAYLALCALHDLDEEEETSFFRQTRLELHRRLDPQSIETAKRDADDPPLYLVK